MEKGAFLISKFREHFQIFSPNRLTIDESREESREEITCGANSMSALHIKI